MQGIDSSVIGDRVEDRIPDVSEYAPNASGKEGAVQNLCNALDLVSWPRITDREDGNGH